MEISPQCIKISYRSDLFEGKDGEAVDARCSEDIDPSSRETSVEFLPLWKVHCQQIGCDVVLLFFCRQCRCMYLLNSVIVS